MGDIDLSAMSKKELKALNKKVSQAIESFDERVRLEALAALEVKAKELGFSLSELTGGKKIKSVNPPKYRNPQDPDQTWTGRGRQPGWVKAVLADGQDLAQFAI